MRSVTLRETKSNKYYILCVCLCVCDLRHTVCKAHEPCYIVIRSQEHPAIEHIAHMDA